MEFIQVASGILCYNYSMQSAVGVWFYSLSTQRYLYLMRQDSRHPNTWGLPGGKCHTGETLLEAIYRECREELGSMPQYNKIVPIEQFTSADGAFCYHTFFCSVESEFQPILNQEHRGYAWINSDAVPRPLHPGLWSTINFEEVMQKVSVILDQISQ